MSGSGDRGTVLLFFPAALLVVVVLAALTVDLARVHLAQRQADDLVAATANDAVTVGLDVDRLRSHGHYRLDPDRVADVVAAHAAAADRSTLRHVRVSWRARGTRSVRITVNARSPLAFATALPGAPTATSVRATADATARLR